MLFSIELSSEDELLDVSSVVRPSIDVFNYIGQILKAISPGYIRAHSKNICMLDVAALGAGEDAQQ